MDAAVLHEIVRLISPLKDFNDETLEDMIKMQWDQISKDSPDEDELKSAISSFIQSQKKTKKRWIKKEMEKGSFLSRELEKAAAIWTGEDGVTRFRETYGYQDFHQMKIDKISELESWSKDDESLSCHFAYFDKKKLWQKEAALKSDIKILCLKHFVKELKTSQKSIVSQLNDWSLIPLDYSGRGVFPDLDSNTDSVSVFTFDASNGINVQAELNIEEIRSNIYASPLLDKLMNDWDFGVLRFVLFKLAETQYMDTTITTSRKEVIDFLNLPNNGRSYEIVEATIKKLISLTVFINMPNKRFSLRFLEDYVLELSDNKEKLTIVLNKEVYTQALNGKTTAMYKAVIDSLSAAATAIIYRLQIVRLQNHYKQAPLTLRVDLDFFRSILVFKGSKKSRMYKIIDSALDEIISMKVTIHSYRKVTDGIYELEFIPLSEQEQRDLGTSHIENETFIFPMLSGH